MILAIIQHTPIWVWVVLIVVLWIGYKSLFLITISSTRLFLLPAILIYLHIAGIYQTFGSILSLNWLYIIVAYIIGAIIGGIIVKDIKIVADKQQNLILLPGTVINLAIIVFNFIIQYIFYAWEAVSQQKLNSSLLVWMIIIGVTTGIILGRNTVYLIKYFKAPHTDLTKFNNKTTKL